MDCSMPDLPVPHHLSKIAHVHVIASVMPSNHLILWCPFLLLLSIFPSIRDFSNVSAVHIRWPKLLEFQLQHQSFQQIFRVDFPLIDNSFKVDNWLVWSLYCSRDSQESSPASQFEGINSLVLHLLYCPALTTVRDYWEKHSLEYMSLCQQCLCFSTHCLGFS